MGLLNVLVTCFRCRWIENQNLLTNITADDLRVYSNLTHLFVYCSFMRTIFTSMCVSVCIFMSLLCFIVHLVLLVFFLSLILSICLSVCLLFLFMGRQS